MRETAEILKAIPVHLYSTTRFKGCIQFINAVNSRIDQKKEHLKLRKGKGKNTTESPETTVEDFPTETKEEENAA